MVHSTIHALSWGLTRLGLAIVAVFFTVVLLFAAIVTVMVTIEAAKAFGQ
jgi:hypothetical protein